VVILKDQLTNELIRFISGFTSWESSVIRSGDLTVSEVHAMEILGQYGEMNMKNLAQKPGVTTGTTTVTVDRLERKDYASRHTTREDRRVYLISLTEKGREAFQEHHIYHLELSEQILSTLTEEEALQFMRVLQRINTEVF
jgi:DNA-binding MarR family transcriptional regulator